MNRKYQIYLTDKEIKLLINLISIKTIDLLNSIEDTITIKRVSQTLLSSYIESDLVIKEIQGVDLGEMG